MAASPASGTPASSVGWIVAGLLLVVAALVFYAIFLYEAGLPFWGLFWIGIVGLVFAGISYLLRSLGGRPAIARSVGWGFYAFGFAVLLIDLGLNPAPSIASVWQVTGLALVVLALAASVAFIGWRLRAVAEPPSRDAARRSWVEHGGSPSAFQYAAAQSPSAPATMPPPGNPNPPMRPGGNG